MSTLPCSTSSPVSSASRWLHQYQPAAAIAAINKMATRLLFMCKILNRPIDPANQILNLNLI
ncbi:hypothetical protein KL86PLE_100450 [uncultured Pleomorphomonas sp.]|uniref:Uncharacterized protein n=1 Tax=uncultured Pleomorphomonas sp. TaxID=442121 RepID=A0A212L3H7_9HYPH|nr:hypothetical protein KL86PLE_100450 [uncultured Pleomorphomonas sp.]